jgi:protein-S-isoprenylcysteine O-methyltransferase Ste14
MGPEPTTEETMLVHSYLFLRRGIGVIGLALPFVLVLGKLIVDGGGLLSSISGYYYTDLRDVFVGSMCAVGIFLLSYRGYDRIDEIASNLAAVAAFGVAFFPTTPTDPTHTDRVIGTLHVVFAGVFFLTLAYFCFFQFTRTDNATPTRRKIQRNGVYLACGVVIVAGLVLIVVFGLFLSSQAAPIRPALWLESAAILAFGVAWLTKGEAILGDLTPAPHPAADLA